MSLEALVKVVAYGVPALLIVLGFFSYLAGYSINAISQDAGMMNGGVLMMVLGVGFYILEFVAKILGSHNSY